MKFNIRGSKISITDAIRSYIETKIGKLDKYFEHPDEITASVLIRESGVNQKIEVTIPIKTAILRGESADKDLYAAIDLVVEKLERQIRKNKTRMHKVNKEIVTEFINFEVTKDEVEDEETIVKRKTIEMKPMNEEEAILQMNMLGHDFFIFKNSETDDVAVVYRRNDKKYGIIDVK
jgi:putative sigma-54 modulation protein